MVAAARQRPCLSLWERCPSAHTGAERVSSDKENMARTPSQSKIGSEVPIFASSPIGRAKAACGGKWRDKLKFEILSFVNIFSLYEIGIMLYSIG